MDEERFLDYVWDVYYYSLDKRYKELTNILYLFNDECHSKDTQLLAYLAKNREFELLFDFMDSLRRGIPINLESIQDDVVEAIRDEDFKYARYWLNVLTNSNKTTHHEINIKYIKFALRFSKYKSTGEKYTGLEDDLKLEEYLYKDLRRPELIVDIISKDKLESLKKEFILKGYSNVDTYTCTDRKGQYHTYAKVRKEIKDVDIEEVKAKVDYEISMGNLEKAKSIVSSSLKSTYGFDPVLVRLYNHLYQDARINRLENHICEKEVFEEPYNILFNYNYGISNIEELFIKALKSRNIDLSNYDDETKGIIYALISREGYKSFNQHIGDKYFRIASNYKKKYPEVNYILNYVYNNKKELGFQTTKSLSDLVRLELKK